MKDIGIRDSFQTAKDVMPQNSVFVSRALSELMNTLSKRTPQQQTPSRIARRGSPKALSGSKEKENTSAQTSIALHFDDNPFSKKTHLSRTPPIPSRHQPGDDDHLPESPMRMYHQHTIDTRAMGEVNMDGHGFSSVSLLVNDNRDG
jgi:hypothetical protein